MSDKINTGDVLLDVKNLNVRFYSNGREMKAVNGVSFNIKKGETFGFVGESGCGKSTTSRAIIRLLAENAKIPSGEIIYKGQDILKLSNDKLRKIRGKEIGMIFQEPMTALNPVLTIKQQMYEQFIGTNMTKAQKEEKAVEMLRLVGIPSPEKRLKDYIHQFSGGMRQRAMIAITLAANPNLLIADEPTTALDVTIQDQIIKLINKIKDQLGMSVLLITHDLGVISQMCDRVAVMYAGYFVETADTLTLFSVPRHPYTKGLIDALPSTDKKDLSLKPIKGTAPSLADLPSGCPFAPRCPYKEDKCDAELPEMKEISPGHMVRCHFHEKLKGAQGLISIDEEGDNNV